MRLPTKPRTNSRRPGAKPPRATAEYPPGETRSRHDRDHLVVASIACSISVTNYQARDWHDRLKAATPDGIDVDFENVAARSRRRSSRA
jgi:hypothetical protein